LSRKSLIFRAPTAATTWQEFRENQQKTWLNNMFETDTGPGTMELGAE